MFEDLKNIFRGGNFIGQIVILCASIFVVQNIIANISPAAGSEIYRWFAMHSFLPSVLTSPWSIITYMFLHGGFSHLFWNMVILYFFGRIVNDFMGKQRLMGLYFLGGIAGALFYVFVYSLMHLGGETVVDVPLVGASAGIMAIVAFAGFRFGDVRMNLLLIGPVQLRYVALGLFVMNTLLDLSMNTGGKMSHLGGAAFGFFYHRSLMKGNDPAIKFMGLFDWVKSFFQKKPKLRVVKNESQYSAPQSQTYEASNETQRKIDVILDKISKSGYDNLSTAEKEFLFKVSNNK